MSSRMCCLWVVFCCLGQSVCAQDPYSDQLFSDIARGAIQTAPTFNSCSYYYRHADNSAFSVEYKRAAETDWLSAHPPVCDQPANIHKGSLFNLAEDTEYQIRILAASGGRVVARTSFRTWTSDPPIAEIIDISKIPSTAYDGLFITGPNVNNMPHPTRRNGTINGTPADRVSGKPDGWIKYTAPPGWIVKRTPRDNDRQPAAIFLEYAQYVILENLTVEGGKLDGIQIMDCDHVRILNCDISNWGRAGIQQFQDGRQLGQYKDENGEWLGYSGGVQIRRSFGTVIERCYIHDQVGRANAWTFSHPSGPQAIYAHYTRGNNVIRWNDFVGSDEHRWNDVIEAVDNGTPGGGLYRDSDIIGNFLAFANDDGIEMEGGGMNLRFIGNRIEGTFCSISTGACALGPQYSIGNLVMNPGDENGFALNFLKNSNGMRQQGKRFVYNNTFHGGLNTYTPYGNAPPGLGLSMLRNNIFVCGYADRGEWLRAENYDNNLYWVNNSRSETEQIVERVRSFGQEKNALLGDPLFVDPVIGNFHLLASSPAKGKAVEVPGIARKGENLGAFFDGITDVPIRPLALVAAPNQVNFESTGGIAVVTLSLPADAAAPVTFQIRQNKVFDWFSVTPSGGTINPGETKELAVRTEAATLKGRRPIFRGAFLVRTPEGLSRPVSVYAEGDYVEDKRPAVAGPNSVYLPANNNIVDAQINIRQAGTYSLLVRASGGGDQNFDILVNGKASTAGFTGWMQWSGGKTHERVIWVHSLGQLAPGDYRVVVRTKNPTPTVAEYIITDKPSVFFMQDINMR